MPPAINSFKPYLPAKDFELSQRFYTALGFTMTPGWGGAADNERKNGR
jgi:predicted lactoylglutathione lyase